MGSASLLRGVWDDIRGETVMRPLRFAAWAAVCLVTVPAGWAAAGLAGFGEPRIDDTAPPQDSRATSVMANAERGETRWGRADAPIDTVSADVAIGGFNNQPLIRQPEIPTGQIATLSVPD